MRKFKKLLIATLNKVIRYQFLEGANHEQSSQNN